MLRSRNLVRANTQQTLTRFRALLAAMVIGMACLVASAAVVGDLVAADARSLDTDSGLSTIELLNVSPSGSPTPLTQAQLSRIRAMPGVEEVVGTSSLGTSLTYRRGGGAAAASAAEAAFAGVFWAMPRFAWSQPAVVTSARGRPVDAPPAKGEVLLPDRYLDVDLSPLVGSEIALEFIRGTGDRQGVPETMTARVVGVFDNADPRRDGDSALYVSDPDFRLMFAALLGSPRPEVPADALFDACLIKAATVADADRVARDLTGLGFYVNSASGEDGLPRVLALLTRVNMIIAGLLALFGIGIGMTLAGTWAQLRRWDVGVLTSLGWSDREILRSYAAELTITGVIVGGGAAAAGALLSVVGGLVTRNSPVLGLPQPESVGLPPVTWLAATVIAVPVAFLLGASVRLIRLTRIEPDDALRRSD